MSKLSAKMVVAHSLRHRPTRLAAWTLVAIGSLCLLSTAAPADIRWHTGIAPTLEFASSADATTHLRELVADTPMRHLIVQFNAPVDAAMRARLAQAGVELQASLGDNAFFANVARDRLDSKAVAELNTLCAVERIERTHKIEPKLAEGRIPDYAIVGETVAADEAEPVKTIAVYVLFHRDVSMGEALATALLHDCTVITELESINALIVELPQPSINALADCDEVQWIELPLPHLGPTNNSNRPRIHADVVQASPYNLDGSGVTVLVYDAGTARASHVDFEGRLTVYDGSGQHYHATHVAGTIGGAGVASAQYKGMAPGVTMLSYGYEDDGTGVFLYNNTGDIEDDYDEAIHDHGAEISNNSIGSNTTLYHDCDITGNYGLTSQLIDTIVRGDSSNPKFTEPFRIVWAAGNERQSTRCGDTFYSTAPPAGAKNHITVGAINSEDDSMTDFSSWGPTDDGRLKPDICGPGCQNNDDEGVTSTWNTSDSAYDTICGTSMACPTVTGASALLMEDYKAQYPGLPLFRNSTLKCWLAHSAVDLGNPGPDYKFGYGSVRIDAAIDLMRTGKFTEDEVVQGQTWERLITVEAGTPQLKITLAWDDYPATPNIASALVNDLDLRVYGPPLVRYYPWTLDPDNPDNNAVQNMPDHINNIEQVVVNNPTPGTYRIQVHGQSVPEGPQPFSLVGDGAINVNTVISFPSGLPETIAPGIPTTIDVIVAGIGEDVVAGSPTLHYRYTGGTWTTVALTHLSGNNYQATLPAASCSDTPEYYFSAEGTISGPVLEPSGSPAAAYTAAVGTQIIIFSDNFETDQGWTAVNLGATSGDWQRGVPVNDPDWDYDPASDSDGSGQCFLTQNEMGNTDVDEGAVQLSSPILDLSGGSITLNYDYFLNLTDEDGNDRLLVEISSNGASGPWTEIARHDENQALSWRSHTITQANLDAAGVTLTANMQLRFTVNDADEQSVVEAGLDAVEIRGFHCSSGPASCNDGILNQGEDRIDCGGPCPACECTSDGTCQDTSFCNGAEVCDAYGDCQTGSDPCPGELCDEVGDQCVECLGDGDCDDGQWCNGAETCDGFGDCQSGVDPCPNGLCDEDADECVPDCNGNGIPDADDLAGGTSYDCNGNDVPDECDVGGDSDDCNANGVPDECELAPANGLAAAYYDNMGFTGMMKGRIDATLAFQWGTGSPWPGFGADTFSVRWTGLVLTPGVTGPYTFYTNTDDGVRLWVNGQLVIDRWVDQAPTEVSGTIALNENSEYPIIMEYYENGGGAVAELRWMPPSQSKVLIPTSSLIPGRDCNDNLTPDDCDIAGGFSDDENGNGIPDECEGCLNDEDCSDGEWCNGAETCDAYGECHDGVPPCEAGLGCFEAAETCCEAAADGDMNHDGVTDGLDIDGFIRVLLDASPAPADVCPGDFDGNAEVNAADIAPMVDAVLGA